MSEQQNPAGLMLGKSEDPFEVAATMFGMYRFQLERFVKDLDAKQLRDLSMALVTMPVDNTQISPDTKVQQIYLEVKSHLQDRENMIKLMQDKTSQLSTGELKRLVNALIQYPLTDKEYIDVTSSGNLREAHNIGERMIQAKSMMLLQAVSEYHEKQQTEQATSVVENNVAGE